MPGVSTLRVVSNPLAANPEDAQGPGLVQQASDFLLSYGVAPESALVGAAVGLFLEPGIGGMLKGSIAGSLVSFALGKLKS